MNRIAEKLALKVKSRRQRHSCLILKGGRILSQANNEKGHAEQLALGIFWNPEEGQFVFRQEKDDMYKGAILISFRITPNGNIGKSKPCANCETAISIAGIRKVIYFDGKVWKEEFR